MKARLTSLLGIALLTALSGCGAATAGGGAEQTAGALSAAEIEALYAARQDSARVRFTEADVVFMQRMIGHHSQALDMANLAPDRDASSQIGLLASRIINAQTDEIHTMEQWLRDRRQPLPAAGHADHGEPMFGMLTADQYRRLEESRGAEFDRLFLGYMIQHHSGAVRMVEDLFATDGAAQDEEVFKFASDALADQGSEIARMEQMLEAFQ